jgi:hypothetical protein
MLRRPNESWIQHTLRRTGWRPQRQAVAVGVLGIFIALVIGALYLSQVAVEASRGNQMRDLISTRDELERQNEELRTEIAELLSLPRLQARAEELGFTHAGRDDIVYLVVDGYNPTREEVVAAVEEKSDEDLPTYSETFEGWVRQQWNNLTSQFNGYNGG